MTRETQSEEETIASSAELGFALFLVSVAVLFAAALVGFFWVRFTDATWQRGLALEHALWLVAAGLCLFAADFCVTRARPRSQRRGNLHVALGLGVLYASVQAWNWSVLAPAMRGDEALEVFTFVLLTGLHGAHVLGGMAHVAFLANREKPPSPLELRLAARYWRFLSFVWLLLLVVLALC